MYRQYSTGAVLLDLEGKAKAARHGLWALTVAERTPPSDWRSAERCGTTKPNGASS